MLIFSGALITTYKNNTHCHSVYIQLTIGTDQCYSAMYFVSALTIGTDQYNIQK